MDARSANHFGALAIGHEMLAISGEIAAGILDQALELRDAIPYEKEVKELADNIWWARRCNFRVFANNQRVGVMTGVAPAIIETFTQGHESAEMKKRVIDPAGFERRAVGELMVPLNNYLNRTMTHEPQFSLKGAFYLYVVRGGFFIST